MAGVILCSVSVEVKGKALKPDKAAKVGLRVEAACGVSAAALEVLGFKRPLRFTQKTVQRVEAKRLAEGRLAIVSTDGIQIVVTQALPDDLETAVRALSGGGGAAGVPLRERSMRAVATPLAASGGGSLLGRVSAAAEGLPLSEAPPGKRQRVLSASAAAPFAAPAVVTPEPATAATVAPAPSTEDRDGLAGGSGGGSKHAPTGLCSLPGVVQDQIWRFETSESARRKLAETCTQLLAAFAESFEAFRLGPRARGVSLEPERIFGLVERQKRTALELSGWTELTAGAMARLAEVLKDRNVGPSGQLSIAGQPSPPRSLGLQIRSLGFRGCSHLSDGAIRRVLSACPQLQSLDVLEVPRLSSRALEAPLPRLAVLACGTLGRPLVAERPRSGTQANQGALTNISGVLGSKVAAPQKQQPKGSMQITANLLNRLSQRVQAEGAAAAPRPPAAPAAAAATEVDAPTAASTAVVVAAPAAASAAVVVAAPAPAAAIAPCGGSPLTHVILAGCAEIVVFPRLPQSLQHLDLRDASIQVPDAALNQWRPLAGCPHLTSLCLAGNGLLSSFALQACIASLPPSARLRVLDLSDTQAEVQLANRLPHLQPALTHLRLANCLGMRNGCVSTLLARLRELEVLDVTGCAYLEEPFGAVASAAHDEAEVAARTGGAPPQQAGTTGVARVVTLQQLAAGTGGAQAAAATRQPGAAASGEWPASFKLRLLGLGRTDFAGQRLEATRRALHEVAPSAHAVASSLDVFGGYSKLPPVLL